MAIALVEERKACGLWQWLALSRLFVYLFFRFSHEPTQLKSKEMSSVCDIRLSTSITLKAENWQVPLQCLVFFLLLLFFSVPTWPADPLLWSGRKSDDVIFWKFCVTILDTSLCSLLAPSLLIHLQLFLVFRISSRC